MSEQNFYLWIDWNRQIMSLTALAEADRVCFCTESRLLENVKMLQSQGFQLLSDEAAQ